MQKSIMDVWGHLPWLCMTILAFAFQDSQAQDRKANFTKIDLTGYGWQPAPRWKGGWGIAFPYPLMAIDHKGRVVVGYPSRAKKGFADQKGSEFSFHVLRFAPDGSEELSVALPTARRDGNSLFLDAEDHLLVKANDEVQILVEDGEGTDKKRRWEPLVPCAKKCRLSQSPSRRTLLVDDPAHNPRLTFIDTSSSQLKVIQRCSEVSPYAAVSFSDEAVYAIAQPPSNRLLYRWPLCGYERVTTIMWPGAGEIHALNEESVAIVTTNVVSVLASDGHKKFEWSMAKDEWGQSISISISEGGDRFAAAIERRGLTWVPSDPAEGHLLGIRIAVYDSKNGEQITSIPANPHIHHVLEFSLSPDGQRLALLEDGTLSVFNLPQALLSR